MGIADFRGEAMEGFAPRGTERRRSTSRAASSSSHVSNVIAGDNDDNDDFMPMAPRRARPRSPEDPDDVCPPSPESPPIRLMAPRMDPPSLFHMSRAWYPISYPCSYPH